MGRHPAAAVDAYLDHLRVERRLADHTLESYARDLAALGQFAAGSGAGVDSLDRQALELFVREQVTRGLSPRSVARTVAAVRGFYRFLVIDRRLDRNPADDLGDPAGRSSADGSNSDPGLPACPARWKAHAARLAEMR